VNALLKIGISIAIITAITITSQYNNQGLFSSSSNNNNNNKNNNSDTYTNIDDSQSSKTLRIGYFPNVNHAQAVIGLKNGDFLKIIDKNENNSSQKKINIKEFVFSDGPSALEALFGGQIDVAYVGPLPAINGFIASANGGLKIISGAASGGASFVVRNDAGIQSVKDLGGKKFASPQIGNTQDISLRKYIVSNGYKTTENGGNVTVIPAKPSDIFTLMLKKEIDGAWVPEPWATRLVKEANGKIFVDERDLWPPQGKFVTANLIVRTDYLNQNPDIIKKLLEAHVNETLWINKNKEKAINVFNTELKKITGKTIANDVLTNALTKLEFTFDPIKISLFKDANDAYDLGFLTKGNARPDLSNIYDLTILNKVLAEKSLTPIENNIVTGLVNKNSSKSGDAFSDIVS
jgi:NitT/TauT family transport system substrate-binding protein